MSWFDQNDQQSRAGQTKTGTGEAGGQPGGLAGGFAASLGAAFAPAVAAGVAQGAQQAVSNEVGKFTGGGAGQTAATGNAAGQNVAEAAVKKEIQKDFLYCIPLMPGFPTPHAKGTKHWMVRILVTQAIGCALRIVVLSDILGGLWMAAAIFVGAHGYYETMNITYVSLWGILCLLNGFFDTLGMIIPGIFGILSFEIWTTLVRVVVPLTYLLGASFAYHLYLDYAEDQKRHGNNFIDKSYLVRVIPDIFVFLKTKVDDVESRYGDKVPFAPHGQQQPGPAQTQKHSGGGWFGSGFGGSEASQRPSSPGYGAADGHQQK